MRFQFSNLNIASGPASATFLARTALCSAVRRAWLVGQDIPATALSRSAFKIRLECDQEASGLTTRHNTMVKGATPVAAAAHPGPDAQRPLGKSAREAFDRSLWRHNDQTGEPASDPAKFAHIGRAALLFRRYRARLCATPGMITPPSVSTAMPRSTRAIIRETRSDEGRGRCCRDHGGEMKWSKHCRFLKAAVKALGLKLGTSHTGGGLRLYLSYQPTRIKVAMVCLRATRSTPRQDALATVRSWSVERAKSRK